MCDEAHQTNIWYAELMLAKHSTYKYGEEVLEKVIIEHNFYPKTFTTLLTFERFICSNPQSIVILIYAFETSLCFIWW